MKVYLDDVRPAPDGWVRTYTVEETIELLKTGQVQELSLDNDLGDFKQVGLKVLDWLEEEVIVNGMTPPKKIYAHTANPTARYSMESIIKKLLP